MAPNYDFHCTKCGKEFEVFKHMWEELEVTCQCGGQACQMISCFQTPRDKLFEFTDVHTTGKPIKFTSKRQWENHLKATGKVQLNKYDLKNRLEAPKEKKSNYRDVAEKAWKERTKFVQEVKYGKRRVNG